MTEGDGEGDGAGEERRICSAGVFFEQSSLPLSASLFRRERAINKRPDEGKKGPRRPLKLGRRGPFE
ncbi:hypothetical protein [Streptomyces sp. NPDC093589]|uniref:hypothetical protein n=1 Tax=Streptomyces sp. NPDC093589 TaxID=3366043 RepID=UPI003818047C